MWQSRPVFVSSTFVDMQAERDYLRTRVFPELEERLAARRHNLEWVDLRVGVATASQGDEHVRELHVLKVCLDEVRRCRPFLIVLLGDRYGWVPPVERIKAAAEEAREGFSADVAGRSVTDLEIEFGVLSDPEQQPRSFFYLRQSLPYAQMPAEIAALYSEDYAADPPKADSKTRLAALKRRIGQQLPARVRHYAVTWDREHQRVAGLEDFGNMVLDDIWAELEAETATSAAAADIPWQQAEREALEDFIDDRARDFVGRQGILASLTGLAKAAGNDGPAWGACVTGDPGSGKSALFGELYRGLQGSDVFLLAHAAGASVNAASVDSMLRRWIGELAGALGTDPGCETMVHLLGSGDWTRATRYYGDRLLTNEELKGATQVLVLSALNDPTELKAVLSVLKPSLNADILKVVAHRYLNVLLRALEGRANAKTKEALALVIRVALDRLHQLYSDDLNLYYDLILANVALAECSVTLGNLARANQWYRDALEVAQSLRTVNVEEEEFQLAVTNSVADVHGRLGRTAWLQGDLESATESYRQMLSEAIENCNRRPRDPTLRNSVAVGWEKLAEMQVARGQLSTADVSLKEAIALRENLVREQANDLLWQRNFGACHIMSGDVQRAEGNRGDAELSYRTSITIFERLVDRDPANANYQRDLSVSYERLGDVLLDRDDLLEAETAYRSALAMATRLADQEPGNSGWQRDLSVSHGKLGYAQQKRADLDAAQHSYRAALTIRRQLAALDSTNVRWLRDVGVSLNDLGDVQLAQEDVHAAEICFGEAMSISEKLSRQNPGDIEWQRDLGISFSRLAKVQMRLKKFDRAEELYRASLAVAGGLTRKDPNNARWLRDLVAIYQRIGEVKEAQGDSEAAKVSYWKSRAIQAHLAKKDLTKP